MKLFYFFLIILLGCGGPPRPDLLPVPEDKKEIPLEQILEESTSSNPQIKAQAILELANRNHRPSLNFIRQVLKKETNPAVRSTAAIALGTLKDRASLSEIVKLFDVNSGISPDIVMESLARMEDPNAAYSILPFLQSPDSTLRLIAVDTLVRIGAKSSGNDILNLAQKNQDPEFAKTYAMALGKLKIKSAEPYLIKLASTTERSPTLAAAYLALGRISGKNGIPILVRGLGGDFDKGSENCMLALIEIRDASAIPTVLPILKHNNRDVRFRASNVLSEIPSSMTGPGALKILEENLPDSIAPASLVLGKIRYTPARVSIEQKLSDSKLPDREIIAQSLGYLGDTKSIPVLISVLRESSGEGRYGAAWSLGALQALDAFEDLSIASKSSDPKLASMAIEALGSLGSKKALPVLAEIAEKNPNSASVVIPAISAIPGEESRNILETFAQKENVALQQVAISELGKRKERSSIPLLIRILEEDRAASAKLLMSSLSSITGKNFYSRNEWLNWYKLNSK
ncbi:HEAT repeat domain-containing protein [Leptospira gomenensis]|uniref:HEAT repeat domain-containing protein n=1 Tax=Leptospira gomenensis TaxID=2484974 RepID=A0A5F1YPY5_9LEPT|nr:HEAT repeat domain-containing protein [Leptospira gomenensis]TGK28083.1 HEAT repeat domain-containing protein [Leptospira gomenensis]TGK37061.1 HEAT repeat domain-containing protein [Leptospira gomenensis]TGK45697.1 HEAT repeat domain-containing protein [Leptospira gomenensis]TGK59636.1 HEAT repeat domain-containing protein [Leptospira gomenensis]